MIKVVDRIGKTHKVGELVYAYFDTLTEKYIVLQKHPEPTTPTIYGTYYPYQSCISVEYANGIEPCDDSYVYKGANVTVVDKLGLGTNCLDGVPAIAVKMEKLK